LPGNGCFSGSAILSVKPHVIVCIGTMS
jgi:hypothetical protein